MNTTENTSTHVYTFYNSRVHICVKASNLAEAIDWLRIIFGESWVRFNIDDLEVNWYKPNRIK